MKLRFLTIESDNLVLLQFFISIPVAAFCILIFTICDWVWLGFFIVFFLHFFEGFKIFFCNDKLFSSGLEGVGVNSDAE